MSVRPTLALCIPAYNAEAYLPTLLESARRQTIPFDEIWVYDDASTDRTALIAEQAGARVVKGQVNRGCSTGRNVLGQKTACDWIHFHDADDALAPDFVERAREWMQRVDPPEIVLFGLEYREADTGGLITTTRYNHDLLRQDAVSYAISEMIVSICGIYRRKRFLEAGGYDVDPRVLYNEDSAMHVRMALAGLRFAADPAITVINYRRRHSMSVDHQDKCFRAQYEVMKNVVDQTGSKYHQVVARRLWEIASASASGGDWENVRAAVALAESVDGRHAPYPRWWMRLLCRLAPVYALRLREALIHLLKPRLRERRAV